MTDLAEYFRSTAKPMMATVARARATVAGPKIAVAPPDWIRERHEVSSRQVGGFWTHGIAPRGRAAERVVLYLHGGAYISGPSPELYGPLSELVDAGLRLELPEYGLAPQHTYREAYEFLTAVYAHLLSQHRPPDISIAGDSAGGGLALGLAQSLLASGLPQPGRLVLIAPWLDLALSNPDIAAAEARDPWLSSVGLREAGAAWAGGEDLADPRLSPITGTLAGLAPMSVYVGTDDLLYPDVRRLEERAAADGTGVDVTVCEGGLHVYPLLPVAEGRAALRSIVDLLSADLP